MDKEHSAQKSYRTFFAMIGTSTVAMFFLMYLHSYELLGHARFSETRLFMTLIMAASMIVIMLGFMRSMYSDSTRNLSIVGTALLIFATSLYLVRSQVTVSAVDYMEGMIPHHSIAILTSERARIEDVRVRALADAIIEAQRREIAEMDWLIADIRANGPARSEAEAADRALPDLTAGVGR